MTDRKELAAKAIAQAQILKMMRAAHDETRAELAELFTDPGEREVGKLLDHHIGTAALERGRETWQIVDEDLFLDWVKTNYVDEVVESVRPSFAAAVLARCKRDGGYVDWETGAVEPPPGVRQRTSTSTLVVRTEKHAGWVITHWLGEAAEQLGIEAPK